MEPSNMHFHRTWKLKHTEVEWDLNRTAFVMMDLWDKHPCEQVLFAVERIAPSIAHLAAKLRKRGVLVLHASAHNPKRAAGVPQYDWVRKLPRHRLPPIRHKWPPNPFTEDQPCSSWPSPPSLARPYGRETDLIPLETEDGIIGQVGDFPTLSQEYFNILEERGIKHVLFVGGATNMCLVRRAFGMKATVVFGRDVAFVRELTNTEYDPATPPYVNVEEGTRIQLRFLESFVAPSVGYLELLHSL